MEAIVALIVIQQTQPFHQIVWLNVLVMGSVKQPLFQQSIPVTTTQPIVEATLTCAYCQHVGHEFKNFPFVDDKLNRLMREELITFLQLMVLITTATHVGVHVQQTQIQPSLVINPISISQHLG
jgi:hypothetical protein